ncbi:MAG: T9SS type A sorting domain-containing protein [Bacteroidota bacterium]|nr:T9SS type A sorting domain-containing protein [Bacteroidota bacterium]MDP4211168.1 T9SS type A sorting domain-containing protein [Bacteroidota bacterium]MDP4249433.1 T9SS type A sorting domain-containing protein [Bacteroidota bacterium]
MKIPILLYPNPVTATIFAQLPSTETRFTILVVNINGRTIRTYNGIIGGHIVRLDVSSFDRGHYILYS